MAAITTAQISLDFKAPDFRLTDTLSDKELSLEELKSDKATVIMFICNHCPYVKHVQEQLVKLANDYMGKGVAFIAINSNDAVNYPEDAPDKMKETGERFNFPFPYLYDETQDIARAYDAACTPDYNIFDGEMKCVYRGQLDDSRPGNDVPVTGSDIRAALDALLEGKAVNEEQKPSIGCSIKWKD